MSATDHVMDRPTTTPTGAPSSPGGGFAGVCPRCGAPLTGRSATCGRCGLNLALPLVAELSDLNLRHEVARHRRIEVIASLDGELAAIDARRAEVLRELGQPTPAAPVAAPQRAGGHGAGTQTLLLALGVLCLAIAAAVFAAVGWDRLNPWGQAAVLLGATLAAGLGGVALFRRGLRATGEAVLGLSGLMVMVNIATFGSALGAGTTDLRFWSVGMAILAALGAATRRWGGRAGGPRPLAGGIIAAVAAQLAAPIGAAAVLGPSASTGFDLTLWDPRLTQAGLAGVAVVLIVQALVVALVAWVRGWKPTSPMVAATLVTATSLWLVAIGMTVALSQSTAMTAILAGAALAAAVAAALPQLKTPGASLAAGASAAAALGAWMAPAPPEVSFTIWVAAGAAIVLVASRLLPSRCSAGTGATGGVALLGTCWVLVAAGVQAVIRLTELVDGNPVTADATPGYSWVDVCVVLSIVTAAAVLWPIGAGSSRSARWSRRTPPVGLALVGYLAVISPPMFGANGPVWAMVLIATAATAAAVAVVSRSGSAERYLGWSLAGLGALLSLILAHATPALALGELGVLALGALGVAAWLGFTGRDVEATSTAAVGTLGAVAAAGYTCWFVGADDMWISVTAAIASSAIAILAVALAGPDKDDHDPLNRETAGFWPNSVLPPWVRTLTWPITGLMLSAQGILALWALGASVDADSASSGAVALLTGALTWMLVAAITTRWVAAVPAAIQAQLAAWLLLGLAGVSILEAYSLPGALALLATGGWWLWRSPRVSSWGALGPALMVGLVPSSLVAMFDGGPRALAVIGAAALITVLGGVGRLAAPVVIGAACVVLLSLVEVAPVIGSLPRYLTFGAAGAALLLTGATFERRRADLAAAHRRLRALR